jgi:hypothetical protein
MDFLIEASPTRIWALDVEKDGQLARHPALIRLCEALEQQKDFLLEDERLNPAVTV